nr:hypothetical protein [Myxococcota bacterium]
ADGSARCWGRGLAGAGTESAPSTCLVDGVETPRLAPASIDPVAVFPSELPLTWRAIGSGDRVRFGLNAAGRAFYWGDYDYDDRPPPDQPVRVLGPDVELVELVTHGQLALARTADGRVFTFGRSAQVIADMPVATDVVAMGNGHAHWCLAYGDGRLECHGYVLRDDWAEGPTGGRLVPRTDTAAITSIAVSYLAEPAVVCWTNADEELWCSSHPDGPLTLVTESRFRSVTVGVYQYGAIDAAGRLWTWHIGAPSRASVTVLPPAP